ncbi:ATP-dependent DNA helicase PIF1 [Artemisia annua]|uniref:ATP-dependent DNA helicase PIF1 n=1 Tax=Artemisia annua TaxID=35608 RepID=A0A2U1LZM7_ARTAN|nr:ATP-dependent DNA helicase PIF1 [Artemisia annua]
MSRWRCKEVVQPGIRISKHDNRQALRLCVCCNPGDAEQIKDFVEWILSIGDGTIGGTKDGTAEVEFPEEMLIPDSDDHVQAVIQETYDNWEKNLWDRSYFQD